MKKITLFALILNLFILLSFCNTVDYTENQSDICKVHSIKMEIKAVPIFYGMPGKKWFDEMKASEELFPNADVEIAGGCILGDKTEALVYHCKECLKAREKWLMEYKTE